MLEVRLDDGLREADTAWIDVRWTTRDGYTFHYTESTRVDLRWGRHPPRRRLLSRHRHRTLPPAAGCEFRPGGSRKLLCRGVTRSVGDPCRPEALACRVPPRVARGTERRRESAVRPWAGGRTPPRCRRISRARCTAACEQTERLFETHEREPDGEDGAGRSGESGNANLDDLLAAV